MNKWKNDRIPEEYINSEDILPSTDTGLTVASVDEIKDHARTGYLTLNIYHVINYQGVKGFHATVSTLGSVAETVFVAGTDSTVYEAVIDTGKALIESEYQKLSAAGRWRD